MLSGEERGYSSKSEHSERDMINGVSASVMNAIVRKLRSGRCDVRGGLLTQWTAEL